MGPKSNSPVTTGDLRHPAPPQPQGHQTHTGIGKILDTSSKLVGKNFTAVSTGKWTERIVVIGTSVAPYLAQNRWEITTAVPSGSDAKTERDNYVATLTDWLKADHSFYYLSVPTTATGTPSGWSTKMYLVQVETSGTWGDEGLLFREHNGLAFRDNWLLKASYDSNAVDEQVRLVPITSGALFYTDRKYFVEGQHGNFPGGYYISTEYTFTSS